MSKSGYIYVLDSKGNEVLPGFSQVWVQPYSKSCHKYSGCIYGVTSWIVKGGAFVGADGASLNNYAKVKTVDDNTVYVPGVGYKTNWDIWKDIVNDKATTDAEEDAWNTRYNLDNDNKDDKEKRRKTIIKTNFRLLFLLFHLKSRILRRKTLKKIPNLMFRGKILIHLKIQ